MGKIDPKSLTSTYWLFVMSHYYPSGGLNDLVEVYGSLRKAKEELSGSYGGGVVCKTKKNSLGTSISGNFAEIYRVSPSCRRRTLVARFDGSEWTKP